MMSGLSRRLAAEWLGTFLLVATIVGSGIMADHLSGGNIAIALLANSVATGAMLFVLITMLGPISGAHLNPAVTAIMALRGEIDGRAALAYASAQLAGGVGGTVAAHAMFGVSLIQLSAHQRTGAGQWLSEGIATFALVLTILGTRHARPAALPASVALVIVAGYWFTASTSFANPAVTLARALSDSFSGIAPADAPAFIAAQLAGAVLGWRTADWLFTAPHPASSGSTAAPR